VRSLCEQPDVNSASRRAALQVFAQKVLPAGDRLAPLFAAAFVALGVWVAVSPGTVPGLHVPGHGAPAMQMDMS